MNGVNHPATHVVDVNWSFNTRDAHNLFEGLVSVAEHKVQASGQPAPCIPFSADPARNDQGIGRVGSESPR